MKTYTKELKKKAVADWRASSMSAREFAERIGVSVHTFKKWLYPRSNCRPAKFVDVTAAAGEKPGAIAKIIRGLGR